VIKYAFTTKASDSSEKPRSARIEGSANADDRHVQDDHQVAQAEDEECEPAPVDEGGSAGFGPPDPDVSVTPTRLHARQVVMAWTFISLSIVPTRGVRVDYL
jgi:hypothetical protein